MEDACLVFNVHQSHRLYCVCVCCASAIKIRTPVQYSLPCSFMDNLFRMTGNWCGEKKNV